MDHRLGDLARADNGDWALETWHGGSTAMAAGLAAAGLEPYARALNTPPTVKITPPGASYARAGTEFLINTQTAGDQLRPVVSGLSDGGFVVTWYDASATLGDASGTSVKAQVYTAAGAKVGTEFLVNTNTANDQLRPTVTGLANGAFVVTWQDTSGVGDTSYTGIKAQLYTPTGARIGGEFLVNTQTANVQYNPRITSLADGGFVVTWFDLSGTLGDASGASTKAQIFTAAGAKVGSEFLVNTQTANDQFPISATGLSNGGFVITWEDASGTLGDASGTSAKGQIYTAAGVKIGGEFLVNSQTAGNQSAPMVTGLDNGGFVVTWHDVSGTLGDASGAGMKAQIYTADGARVGSEFLVNTQTAGDQLGSQVTRLGDGGFLVAWFDASGTLGDASGTSIKAQAFTATGARIGGEFLVNTQTGGNQQFPAVTGLANGGFVVTWHDASGTLGDASGSSAKGQIYSVTPGAYVAIEQVATSLKGTITIGDPDSGTAGLLSVTLAASFGTLTLAAGTSGATIVSGNGTGSVVISGTVAQLNALLGSDTTSSIGYAAPTDAPPASATITVTAEDAFGGQATQTASIAFTAVNDAPVLDLDSGQAGTGSAVTFTDGAVTLAPNATLTDDNAGYTDAVLTVAVMDGGQDETLSIVASGDLTRTGASIYYQNVLIGTVAGGNGADLKVIFNASASAAAVGAVMAHISYANEAAAPGMADRSVTFTLVDGGGTENSGHDTGTAIATISFPVPVNAAPTLTISPPLAETGPDHLVNTGPGEYQPDPVITVLADGGYVVVWEFDDGNYEGVHFQRYDAAGVKQGGEVQVNTTTDQSQSQPSAAALENGGFVIVWTSFDQDHDYDEIYSRQFDSNGAPLTGEVRVNTTIADSQSYPHVVALDDGYVVVWRSERQDGEAGGVYLQRFDATGAKQGDETRVNTHIADDQTRPELARQGDGFIVTWMSNGQDGGEGSDIYTQLFSATGVKLGGEVRANATAAGSQFDPVVTQLANGDYVVVWTAINDAQDGSLTGVYLQRFNADGVPQGDETQVNTYTDDLQEDPAVAALSDGGFVVAWKSYRQDGDSDGVYSQRYDAAGVPQGGEIRVAAVTEGSQYTPSVTAFGGGYIVTWAGEGGVFTKQYGHGVAATEQTATSLKGMITVGDADAGASPLSITLAVDHGTVTLDAGTSGATILSGNGSASVVVSGTLAQLNALLAEGPQSSIAYLSSSDTPPAMATLTVTADDGGNSGQPAQVTIGTVPIYITAIDDAPTLAHAIPDQAGTEDTVFSFTVPADTFADVDSSLTYTATDDDGEELNDWLTFDADTRTFSGTPPRDYNGTVTVRVIASDGTTDLVEEFDIVIAAANDAPKIAIGLLPDSEFLVNTNTESYQSDPVVTYLDGGGFVVVWGDFSGTLGDSSYASVKAQVYDAQGAKLGSEFLVNTETEFDQAFPSVAALTGGGFAIAWHELNEDFYYATQAVIKVQRYDAAGETVGPEIAAGEQPNPIQLWPGITGLRDGGFVVSWEDQSGELGDPDLGIAAQVFDAAGAKVGGVFLVNTQTEGYQREPSITALSNGGFVVTWTENNAEFSDGYGMGIKAQIYDASGNAVGSEFIVSIDAVDSQSNPSVAGLAGGGFVVVWDDYSDSGPDTDYGSVKGRVFANDGTPLGSDEFLANTTTLDSQSRAVVASLKDGGFVVAWEDYSALGGDADNGAIKAQTFDASGEPRGSEFVVNEITDGNQGFPAIAGLPNGGFVATWGDYSRTLGDSSGNSVKARVFSPLTALEDQPVSLKGRIGIADVDGDGQVTATLSVTHGVLNLTAGTSGAEVASGNGTGTVVLSGTIAQINTLLAAGSDGTATFMSDVPGASTLTISVDDGEDVGQASLVIPVAAAPVPPAEARDDTATTAENHVVAIAVLANEVVPDGAAAPSVAKIDGATGSVFTLASGAEVTINPDGTLSYDPHGAYDWLISAVTAAATHASNVSALDSFTYTLATGSTATVRVTVNGVTSAGDRLVGTAADDTIKGTAGNDVFDGGPGADRMVGGTGDDIYTVDNPGDIAQERADQGYDIVYAAVSYSLVGQFVEELRLTGAAISGTGTGYDNVLVGNAQENILDGGEGNDRLDGGVGADRMIGGLGDDVFIVDNAGDLAVEGMNGGTDTVRASVGYSLIAQYVENLVLTGSAAINGTGNALANLLTGNSAANTLDGGDGNDTIDGGGGADTMIGGAGNDIFYVDQLGDLAVEAGSGGDDKVYASISYSLAGQYIETLVLTGSSAINGTGNALANTLTGNGAANTLDGGAGNDVIDGGGGVDTMIGGTGDDIFYVGQAGDLAIEYSDQGIDTVVSMVGYSLAGQYVENLTLAGGAAITGTGNKLANILTGNTASNTLDGGEGNDRIDGGGGADTMIGGLGDDIFYVDQLGDVAVERLHEGNDTVYASISYSLSGQYIETLVLTGGGDIDGTGTKYANTLTGNGGANQLHGGMGGDTLTGGGGADGFWFDTALDGTFDTITDFDVAADTIHLDRAIFTGIGASGELGSGAFASGVAAQDADDRIVYDSATGNIYYDADGSGAAAAVLIAQVTAGTALTHADFFAHP
ncbi:MAG: putative Ig domain-containing protein [Pseudomonadota bacterium]